MPTESPRHRGDSARRPAASATASPARRRGRRPGPSTAREDILRAAVHQFTADGYAGATLRSIAAEAGADPALVHHYFGTKAGLFREALGSVISAPEILTAAVDGDGDHVGERLAAHFLILVGEPDAPGPLVGLIRSALASDEAARLLRRFVVAEILELVAGVAAGDHPRQRAAMCGSQLLGVAVARNVLGLDPLVAMDFPTLTRILGRALHDHLTAPLPGVA